MVAAVVVDAAMLAAGAAALLATSPFSALRWHIVLAAETTSPGPWTLLKIVLVGLFKARKSLLHEMLVGTVIINNPARAEALRARMRR